MTKKLIACLLAVVTLLPLAAGCSNTNAEVTTDATTTVAATTAFPRNPLPSDDMESVFAEPSWRLARQIVKNYWSKGSLKGELNSSGMPAVWGYAGFMEGMAEAYRLFPDDKNIKTAYIDSVNDGIMRYKTSDTITTPDGQTHEISYYNAGAGGKGDFYYDDNAWICVQFLNAYDQLKDEKYLKEAEEMLKFFWTGWDETLGGGIYWDNFWTKTDENGNPRVGSKDTCGNGPIAISFLWAYQFTKNEEYLEKGKMIYDWVCDVLLDKSNNLFHNSINVNGEINTWKASYNQGVMIYAASQLYEITGDETYLNQARATNDASIDLMFKEGRGNSVTMNGNPIFKCWCVGWLVRGYLKFYSVNPEKDTTAMDKMSIVLEKNLETKNSKGYYDPYFMTGDWSSESVTDVLQPCGMLSIMSLTTYYDIAMKTTK